MAAYPDSLNTRPAHSDHIREMTSDDLGRVIDVELAAYEHPWTVGIFRDCLRVGYSCWVYEDDDNVVGYGIVMLSGAEAHILNLCVHPECQRRGIGRLMLNHITQVSRESGADTILLEVRQSNLVAIQLYLSADFHELGVRSGYYPDHDGREDALILAKSLISEYDPMLGI
jgi:ribosomal-protein-alanine N-acetyltransferase